MSSPAIAIALCSFSLTSYSTRDQQNIPESIQLFDIFSEQIAEVIKVGFIEVSLAIEPRSFALEPLEYAPGRHRRSAKRAAQPFIEMLSRTVRIRQSRAGENQTTVRQHRSGHAVSLLGRSQHSPARFSTSVQTGTQAAKELVKMLKIPIDCYDILDVLKLNHYKLVLQLLSYRERHTVCMYIINSILEKETIIPTADQVTQLFDLIATLIVDQTDNSLEHSRQSITNEDFVEEQNLVARLCNNFKAPNDPDQQYHIIKICQDTFKNGGLERMRFTYPPIIMQAYALTFRYKDIREQVGHSLLAAHAGHVALSQDEKWEKKCQKLFQLCNQLINTLTKLDTHDLPLRLYLQGALAASEIRSENAETIAYEFFSQVSSSLARLTTPTRCLLRIGVHLVRGASG